MGFAERLKELRNENQCTQKKLAAFLGLTPNTICEWEKNRSEPSIETIVKLSSFFEVSAGYLLGLEDDFGTPTAARMHAMTGGENSKLLEKEKALLKAFKKLLPETQDFILRTVQSLSNTSGEKSLNKT